MNFDFAIAALSIILHVANYNFTARLEHKTRIFTNLLGPNAVYFYAVYLIVSALIRDHFIHLCIQKDQNSLHLSDIWQPVSMGMFAFGVFLNLWTLQALGIKGMYNGDSFGHLMDAPVTSGPYRFLEEPQYVGTSICLLASGLYYQSLVGLQLAVVMYVVFTLSVELLEKPHMKTLYSSKKK